MGILVNRKKDQIFLFDLKTLSLNFAIVCPSVYLSAWHHRSARSNVFLDTVQLWLPDDIKTQWVEKGCICKSIEGRFALRSLAMLLYAAKLISLYSHP